MRHRFHSICPYFAMFPETFVEKHLAATTFAFEAHMYKQVDHLRTQIAWQTDRFIVALCLGALHGESHRSPNYFSNRMPRTISTKPAYSVRWWEKHGYTPPARDVFAILRHVNAYRYRTPPPSRRGRIALSDARRASERFPDLEGQVTDVITSPPYLDTTNYREDQWLWLLGDEASSSQLRDDGRYYTAERYWAFLQEAWQGVGPLLSEKARIVVRIGAAAPRSENGQRGGCRRFRRMRKAGWRAPALNDNTVTISRSTDL